MAVYGKVKFVASSTVLPELRLSAGLPSGFVQPSCNIYSNWHTTNTMIKFISNINSQYSAAAAKPYGPCTIDVDGRRSFEREQKEETIEHYLTF